MRKGYGADRQLQQDTRSGHRSQRVVEDYLNDILSAISKIDQYMAGVTEDLFRADGEKQDAVSRRLQAIGEAAKYIPKAPRDRHSEIPWTSIMGMRNVLSHAYYDEDPALLWRTAQLRLTPLRIAVHDLLDGLVKSPGV